jgi:hypothetical protein
MNGRDLWSCLGLPTQTKLFLLLRYSCELRASDFNLIQWEVEMLKVSEPELANSKRLSVLDDYIIVDSNNQQSFQNRYNILFIFISHNLGDAFYFLAVFTSECISMVMLSSTILIT